MASITVAMRTEISNLYVSLFGRAPDGEGLGFWVSSYANGNTIAKIAQAMYDTAPARAYYPLFATPSEVVTTFYTNVLGRAPDAEGLAFWVKEYNASATQGAFFEKLINNVVNYNGTDAAGVASKSLFANKVAVAQYYGEQNGTVAGATAALNGVTSDAASVDTAKAAILNTTGSGQTFMLTAGIDTLTGTAGNDVFAGSKADGTNFFTSLDKLDGGAGIDSLDITVTAAFDSTAAVGATVTNIENVNITSTGAVTANTTAWTGVTALTTASTGNSTITAAATTDVVSTVASPTGAGAAVINGGKAITLTSTDTATTGAASANTIAIGGTTAATGAVTVTQTETITDAANAGIATGTIAVTGGTTIAVNSLASVGAGSNVADVVTIGAVTVQGNASTTSVSVTQSAATAAYAAAGDKIKITNGAVTVTDLNTATKADTITTVTLNNFGNSTIQGNALTTLNLTGGAAAATASGTVGISQSAGLTTSAPTTLSINMTSGRVGVITDTNDQYTTVNVASAAASTIAGLDFTNATTLNVSGAGLTTISAQTDLAKVTAITSTGGGLSLAGAISNTATFTGGDGKDSVEITATTKAITMGAGDDTVTITASALGTGGSVDAGEGTDTLSMTAANAVTASAATTFETKISGFERLSLGAVAASGTVNLANLDDLNDVAIAGVDAGQALTLSGAQSGVNLRFADATQTSTIVALANEGSADVANVFLTTADNSSTLAALDLTGFETINIASADTDTDTTAASNALTALTAAAAKSIVVTGNAGFALANGFTGTALTNFDASAVTAGAVTYTSGVLAAASTIKGGAGADTLNLAAAVAATNIDGGAGADILTGSSTKANTIQGGAGNDTITGGGAADIIDGGAGTDTFVATLAEQAGASTTDGVVINLGDTELTQSAVFTLTGKYLASVAPTVAAGTGTYLFSSESTTNAAVVDQISNIENITGTSGVDYIVGSSGANVIRGLAGVDYITTGAGADTVELAAIAVAGSVAGADIITDFTAGSGGDLIRVLDADYAWFNGTSDGVVSLATGASLDAAHAANNNFTVATISTNVATHTVATYLAGNSTIAQLEGTIATALGAAADLSFANTDNILVAVDDGASTMLVRVVSAADGAAIAVAELSLVGILQGVSDATSLVAANFAFA